MHPDQSNSADQDVLLDLGADGRPGVQSLARALREAIRAQRLRPGVRLPASRALARQVGCSRWVVVQVYEQLTAEGYLAARVGSGTRVLGVPTVSDPIETTVDDPGSWLFDFRPGIPDLGRFPRAEWLRAARTAFTNAPTAAFDYGDPQGLPQLRSGLADYLGRVRGAAVAPADVAVTTGSVNALNLIAHALVAQGISRVGIEDPGWIQLRRPFAGAGVETVPIRVDADGIVVDDLRRTGVRAVLVTPVHQFPAGSVLSASRRRALLDWAQACDGLVIEDDYDAEYRYDGSPLGVLQGLAPGRVLLVGTVSKSLSPAMRLGWMVCPPAWREPVARVRAALEVGVSVWVQLAFAEFLAGGGFEQHLRRMRKDYQSRRAALVAGLGRHFPGSRVHGIAAGLHLMTELGVEIAPDEVRRRCAAAGIRVYPLQDYVVGPVPDDYEPATVVLGFGAIPAHRLDAALTRMAAALR